MRKLARAAAGPDAPARPGGDDLPYVFSGALVVRGTGVAEVTATGAQQRDRQDRPVAEHVLRPSRRACRRRRNASCVCSRWSAAVVSVLAVLLYGLFRGGWLDALLAGIALGMSMLPEEFPLVLTVFMVMGAWRISRRAC